MCSVWCGLSVCRLVATDEENKRLKIEMSEIKARHKIELQQVQKKMEQEMEEVHQRCVCACARIFERDDTHIQRPVARMTRWTSMGASQFPFSFSFSYVE